MTRKPTGHAENPLDFGILPTLLGFQLRQAQGWIFADFIATMADDGVTPGQFGLLVLIAENNGPSQSALARALGVERSTMVTAINKLESRGLVQRRASDTDQRANELVLTPDGVRLMARLLPMIRDHEKRITENLGDNERAELFRLLTKMTASGSSG